MSEKKDYSWDEQSVEEEFDGADSSNHKPDSLNQTEAVTIEPDPEIESTLTPEEEAKKKKRKKIIIIIFAIILPIIIAVTGVGFLIWGLVVGFSTCINSCGDCLTDCVTCFGACENCGNCCSGCNDDCSNCCSSCDSCSDSCSNCCGSSSITMDETQTNETISRSNLKLATLTTFRIVKWYWYQFVDFIARLFQI